MRHSITRISALLALALVAAWAVPSLAGASARYHVSADIDAGGGVLLANRPGGYYMGRLFVGWSFDRHGAWYFGGNSSDYAWSYAYGHSQACLWTGPSAGKSGFTAGTWAANQNLAEPDRCTDTQRSWLESSSGSNIGSHFNCDPGTGATNGTEKPLLTDATLYWNVTWSGGTMGYDGGTLSDPVATITAGTHVWYRYTTRDGNRIVAFVPGRGWGFFPIGVLDRSRTGTWSNFWDPGTVYSC